MNVQKQYQDEILEKIHNKGWNPYRSTDCQQIGAEATIGRGRVDELIIGERYVLMPRIEEHNNQKAVFTALEKVAREQLNRETPTIEIGREIFPWTGFIPREEDVKVNTTEGHYVSYPEFIRCLDSITQIRP